MEARAKFLGHPVHQILIVFPLGLLSAAWLFDVVYWFTHNVTFATVAYWNIAAGVIGGLVAAVFGLIDWLSIPVGTRAKTVGIWHASVNVLVLVLFAISWVLRAPLETHAATGLAFGLSTAAFALAGLGGWLGGDLVNRYSVGVKDGANLDAPGPFAGGSKDKGVSDGNI